LSDFLLLANDLKTHAEQLLAENDQKICEKNYFLSLGYSSRTGFLGKG